MYKTTIRFMTGLIVSILFLFVSLMTSNAQDSNIEKSNFVVISSQLLLPNTSLSTIPLQTINSEENIATGENKEKSEEKKLIIILPIIRISEKD